MQSEIQ